MGQPSGTIHEGISDLSDALKHAFLTLSTAELSPDEKRKLSIAIDNAEKQFGALRKIHDLNAVSISFSETTLLKVNTNLTAGTTKATNHKGEHGGREVSQSMEETGGLSSVRREVVILETLAHTDRLFEKNEIIGAVRKAGYGAISEAAIVTQLHRMKTDKMIERPYRGAYLITDAGRKRLAQQRTRLGDKALR